MEGRDLSFSEKTTARYHAATPDYFRALGIPLLYGRFFDAQDGPQSPAVIVVNKAMAHRYWPGEQAVGKRISFLREPKEKDWLRVVGVVGDIRDDPGSNDVRPAFWLPHTQEPDGGLSVVVRSRSNPPWITRQLRSAVARLDTDLAVSDVRLMTEVAAESIANQRFALFLVVLFAGLALVLCAIGIYGVISYSVNQRMQEFGMRIALGAAAPDLMRLIVGHSFKLSLAGCAIGLACATAFARVLEALLYGVRGLDPATYGAVATIALSTAVFASYLPGRRATRADPMTSLRTD